MTLAAGTERDSILRQSCDAVGVVVAAVAAVGFVVGAVVVHVVVEVVLVAIVAAVGAVVLAEFDEPVCLKS